MEASNYTAYDKVIYKIRFFFKEKGFIEVFTQNNFSVIEPMTNSELFTQHSPEIYYPQTKQIQLDQFLLENPQESGFFSISYQFQENTLYPFIEFTSNDNIRQFYTEFFNYMGLNQSVSENEYDDICNFYEINTLTDDIFSRINQDYGTISCIDNFPERVTSSWNIQWNDTESHYYKNMILINGINIMNLFEKSCNTVKMYNMFHTDNIYLQQLYQRFGEDRVENELNEFLQKDFLPRIGGTIDITKIISIFFLFNLI